jgi:hypothetical protein
LWEQTLKQATAIESPDLTMQHRSDLHKYGTHVRNLEFRVSQCQALSRQDTRHPLYSRHNSYFINTSESVSVSYSMSDRYILMQLAGKIPRQCAHLRHPTCPSILQSALACNQYQERLEQSSKCALLKKLTADPAAVVPTKPTCCNKQRHLSCTLCCLLQFLPHP